MNMLKVITLNVVNLSNYIDKLNAMKIYEDDAKTANILRLRRIMSFLAGQNYNVIFLQESGEIQGMITMDYRFNRYHIFRSGDTMTLLDMNFFYNIRLFDETVNTTQFDAVGKLSGWGLLSCMCNILGTPTKIAVLNYHGGKVGRVINCDKIETIGSNYPLIFGGDTNEEYFKLNLQGIQLINGEQTTFTHHGNSASYDNIFISNLFVDASSTVSVIWGNDSSPLKPTQNANEIITLWSNSSDDGRFWFSDHYAVYGECITNISPCVPTARQNLEMHGEKMRLLNIPVIIEKHSCVNCRKSCYVKNMTNKLLCICEHSIKSHIPHSGRYPIMNELTDKQILSLFDKDALDDSQRERANILNQKRQSMIQEQPLQEQPLQEQPFQQLSQHSFQELLKKHMAQEEQYEKQLQNDQDPNPKRPKHIKYLKYEMKYLKYKSKYIQLKNSMKDM